MAGEVVAAAVSIDSNRGDQIVVQTIPFDQPAAAEAKNLSWLDKNKDLTRTAIKYGLLVMAALLLILFVVRPARRALRLAAKEQLHITGGGGMRLALPSGQAGMEDTLSVRSLAGGEGSSSDSDITSPRTVAEIEAEMEAKVAREMNSLPAEAVRASAIKKQLVERAKQKPDAIAMTLRGWLQEKN